jgi:hypothetical protein
MPRPAWLSPYFPSSTLLMDVVGAKGWKRLPDEREIRGIDGKSSLWRCDPMASREEFLPTIYPP